MLLSTHYLQGIHMLQALSAMKKQAGVMREGAAEAVAEEEHNIRSTLAALPTDRLPQYVQQQLLELGVCYGGDAAVNSAFDDFEVLDEMADGPATFSSEDQRAQDLADITAHFKETSDFAYVLEHLEESAAAAAVEEAEAKVTGPTLLSHACQGLDTELPAGRAELMLSLDQEIELQPADMSAATSQQDDITTAPGITNTAAGSSSGTGGLHEGNLQWPAGMTGGKVSVLGQMKSSKRAQALPPSNKPLKRNVQVKPTLEVRYCD